MTITPKPGAAVAAYPAGKVIASSNAAMSIDGIRLGSRTDFVLNTAPAGGRIPLGTYPIDLAGLRRLAGFELGTDIRVTVLPGTASSPPGAEIVANLKLPTWLTIGGVRAQGQVTVRAFADGKLILDHLRIGPIDADIANALNVERLQLDYTATGPVKEWRGQGKACVVGGTCLDMIPPNGQVVIANDALKLAGATLQFPPPGIPLFPGLNLDRIGFTVGLDPTLIAGNARVTALKIYQIDGRLLLAFPSAATPYVFSADTAGGGFPAHYYGRVHTQPTVAIAASAALKVPVVGSIPLGNGYFVYEYPGYVGFGGGVDQNFFGHPPADRSHGRRVQRLERALLRVRHRQDVCGRPVPRGDRHRLQPRGRRLHRSRPRQRRRRCPVQPVRAVPVAARRLQVVDLPRAERAQPQRDRLACEPRRRAGPARRHHRQ